METRNLEIDVKGDAVCFHSNAPLSRATIKILGHQNTVKTDDKGHFSFRWTVRQPLTMFLETDAYRVTQSATFIFTEDHLKSTIKITYQVPHWFIFPFFSIAMLKKENPNLCQIAGTVTAHGKTFDDLPHGEADVTVKLYNEAHQELNYKPHYFGIFEEGSGFTQLCSLIYRKDLTNRTSPFMNDLKETSLDGGFIFLNIPPGRYFVKAIKTGYSFPEIEVRPQQGKFINIFPGTLQAMEVKHAPKPIPRRAPHSSFFKPALALGAGVLGLATYGIGTAIAVTATTYMATRGAESLSGCCRKKR